MAKNATVLRCPKCGSIYKTALKPDFFKCDNCKAIYSVHEGEVSIYTERKERPLSKVNKITRELIFLVTALLCTGTFLLYIFQFSVASPVPFEEEKPMDYNYIQNWIYVNKKTQQPVLLRLAAASIDENDRTYDFIDIRSVFIDPVARKRVANQVLLPKLRRLNNRNFDFHSFSNGAVYLLFNKERIFKVDQEKNQLIEVTKTLFDKHPELNSGILTVDFMGDDPILNEVMDVFTKDSKHLYYAVAADQFFSDRDEVVKLLYPDSHRFVQENEALQKVDSSNPDDVKLTTLVPGKKYPNLKVVYDQQNELLITTSISENNAALLNLQSIDPNTGQVKWTFPLANYTIENILKYPEGFAIQYSINENMDAVSGVILISNQGKLLTNYVVNR